LRSTPANADRVGQQLALTVHVVPVIALHLAVGFGDHHATQAVARRRITADKTMAVAVHAAALVGAQGGAVGILDPRVGIERRRFAGQRLFDGLFRGDVPGMEQVEILQILGHQRLVGQARAFILGRVLGNRQCGGHRLANRFRPTRRGAGRAFALATYKVMPNPWSRLNSTVSTSR